MMRPLSRLWQSLETIPGLVAIPAFWEVYCGPDIEVIQPHLRVTGMEGALYPCPKPRVGYCPRRIVDYGNGEFAAICRDPHQICEKVALTQRDVLLQELDVASFTKVLAGPLGIQWQDPVSRGDHTWGIGLSNRRDTKARPVFLVLLAETGRFQAVVHHLLLTVSGPFVLVAPTGSHRTIELQELLHARGVSFLALEEHLMLDDAGRLVAAAPQEAAGEIRATPKEDRARVVKEFLTRNNCKVKDIQKAAAIYQTDYYKWLSGSVPDHYSTCIAIERVLVAGIPQRETRASS